MKQITKSLAEHIAIALTEKTLKKFDAQKDKTRELAERLVLAKVPKEVIALWSKKSEYIRRSSRFCFIGKGLNHEYLSFKVSLPQGASSTIALDEKDAIELYKAIDKENQLLKELRDLRKDIVYALLTLKTPKRIIEKFPETEKFFPKEGALLPTIVLEPLILKIKNQ